jgi:hypothetical protein
MAFEDTFVFGRTHQGAANNTANTTELPGPISKRQGAANNTKYNRTSYPGLNIQDPRTWPLNLPPKLLQSPGYIQGSYSPMQ